jgi:ligand-binding sensor domain-containing protein
MNILGWWQNNVWHQLDQTEGWPGYDSLCVLPKKNGSVWVSTVHHGLWRFSGGKFGRVKLSDKPPKEPFTDLMEDRRRRLWMVTENSGVFCLETNKLTSYTTRKGLPSQFIRRII